MAKKIIFLDRDGTLNVDEGYTYQLEKYQLLDGVKEGLKKLTDQGFKLVILTSQSGIGRGMYSEAEYGAFMDRLLGDLRSAGVEVLGSYHCPHHAEHGIGDYKKDCDCRKPKPGLVHQAEKDHGPFDYEASWSIGDSVRDLEMTTNAHPNIRTVLLPKNYGTEYVKPMEDSAVPNFKAQNFLEAAEIILANS